MKKEIYWKNNNIIYREWEHSSVEGVEGADDEQGGRRREHQPVRVHRSFVVETMLKISENFENNSLKNFKAMKGCVDS